MPTLRITFGSDLDLDFYLEPNPIAELWADKMRSRHSWPLDDAERFYGFNVLHEEQAKAERDLRDCITTINDYMPIIEREFMSVTDQDMLNYLHHIFEQYHGLLDQQQTEWFQAAPLAVQRALANLNIAVHRAETVCRGSQPRFVCTWFGMPKDSELTAELISRYGSLSYEFGGVYLNYVEIGKTLEDLSQDDDQYIGDDAFQPFRHYSADFSVRFYDDMADVARAYRYFEQHRPFFEQRGIYAWDDYRVKPVRFKVARLHTNLDRESVITRLSKNQHITDIYLG